MAGARTEEIAAAAHANKAMLYYYFGDKRHLHRAVLENLFRQLRNGVYAPRRKQASPRERLRELVTAISIFWRRIRIIRGWCSAKQWKQQEFEWIVRQYLRPFHNQLVRTIEEGIAAGEFRAVDPHHTAFTILGMTTSYFAAAPILSQIAGRNLLAPHALGGAKACAAGFSGSWTD